MLLLFGFCSLGLAGQERANTPGQGASSAAATPAPPAPQSRPSPGLQPLQVGNLAISGSIRTRLETWDWFEGNANDSYAFLHSIFRVALGQQKRTLDWQIELAAPFLLGLPSNAIAPGGQGQMGLGGTYFAANGAKRNVASVFVSKAFLRFKGLGGKDSNYLRLGRFEFVEGTEVTPKDTGLAVLKAMRINHRLIGSFPWPVNARSQDGITLALNPGRTNLTLVASRPTRGIFQTDGWGELDINLIYGAFTVPTSVGKSNGELRLFGIGYDDRRAVIKTDNRALAVRNGPDRFQDVEIGTFGAHYLHLWNQPSGKFDVLVWVVGQTGSWGVQKHRAWALATEAGWQPQLKLWPWFRLGYFHGSGDANGTDNTHGTFFQLLPTPRWYARYPFYNLQNNEDYSAMMVLRPDIKWTIRSEFHALRLSESADLWYQGGGAFQPRTFGYVGRPSGGNRGFGNLWDASADYNINAHWALGLYFANVWGKGVMKSLYPRGQNSRFGYTELTYRF